MIFINLKLKKRVYILYKDIFAISPLTKLSLSNRQEVANHNYLSSEAASCLVTGDLARHPAMPARVVDTATPSSQPSPGYPESSFSAVTAKGLPSLIRGSHALTAHTSMGESPLVTVTELSKLNRFKCANYHLNS